MEAPPPSLAELKRLATRNLEDLQAIRERAEVRKEIIDSSGPEKAERLKLQYLGDLALAGTFENRMNGALEEMQEHYFTKELVDVAA